MNAYLFLCVLAIPIFHVNDEMFNACDVLRQMKPCDGSGRHSGQTILDEAVNFDIIYSSIIFHKLSRGFVFFCR